MHARKSPNYVVEACEQYNNKYTAFLGYRYVGHSVPNVLELSKNQDVVF